MAVSVQQAVRSTDGQPVCHRVEYGYAFVVEDNALVVLDSDEGQRLAVFPAGSWLSAEVDDD